MVELSPEWRARLAEAYCVENGIACHRRFTDADLEEPRREVREAAAVVRYVDAALKRDRLTTSRPDHDMTSRGGSLKDAA